MRLGASVSLFCALALLALGCTSLDPREPPAGLTGVGEDGGAGIPLAEFLEGECHALGTWCSISEGGGSVRDPLPLWSRHYSEAEILENALFFSNRFGYGRLVWLRVVYNAGQGLRERSVIIRPPTLENLLQADIEWASADWIVMKCEKGPVAGEGPPR